MFYNVTASDFIDYDSWSLESGETKTEVYKLTKRPIIADRTLRFAVISDYDISDAGQKTLKDLEALDSDKYDFLLHIGDFAYDIEDNNGEKGDKFFEKMSKTFSTRIPYMITAGNHETELDSDNGNLLFYRFNMTGFPVALQNDPTFPPNSAYTFKAKNAFFVHVNFDLLFKNYTIEREAKLLSWLDSELDLARKSWSHVDWVIFYAHRPFYCTDMREEVDDCKTNMFYFRKVETVL